MAIELNRVSEDLTTWRDREERFEKLFPGTLSNNLPFLKEKLDYLNRLQAKYGRSVNTEELLTLRILKQERRALAVKVYPNPLLRLLHNILLPFRQKEIERISDQRIDENIRSLKEQMSMAGFKQLTEQLENQVKQGQKGFDLTTSYYVSEKERIEYNLSFSKDSSGEYRFENYKASLRSENNSSDIRQHSFEMQQGQIFTAEQAQHLLAGRALQSGQSWMQFDLNDKDATGNFRIKHFPENYGYDIKQSFERTGIKELVNGEVVNKAILALKSGQRHELVMNMAGKEQKLLIEANPQHKTINIFDGNNQPYHINKATTATSQNLKQQNKQKQPKENTNQTEKTNINSRRKTARRRISQH